ncbi:hypothetical protein J27TS7_35310 [Paenibacillus dendritiformis]|uniref:non-ribosomal peptide synthetase n=1 Tax=Paenibacillus dendritiformis TaxID=130049 RepID=UPI001B2F289E|nr:non-ribosomal peptide synthetase [Paenibacillus dendritiformis]GIO74017.1 hypothetical protein J27TS7_35310 [Paenibacillus dendritiformis]
MNDLERPAHTVLHRLTHPQQRIWTVENIFPHSSLHNIGGVSRVQGRLDFDKMERAIRLFVQSHAGIRLTLVHDSDDSREIKQFVGDAEAKPVDRFDFSQEASPNQAFDAWVRAKSSEPFPLIGQRLYYFALFTLSTSDNGFFVKLHHIIADGWSMAMLTRQIWSIYTMLLQGEETVPDEAPAYSEYIAQEEKYLSSRRFEQDRSFWLDKFQSLPESVFTHSAGVQGRRISFPLDAGLSSALKAAAVQHSYSMNTYFTALYFLYLNKVTGRQEAVIGTPVFNRSGVLQKSIFGMFTSTMPFRFRLDEHWTFRELLEHLHADMLLCYKHHKYPYNLLLQDLHANGMEQKSLFDFCVNYYNTSHITKVNGAPVTNTEFYSGEQLYAMQWIIRDWSDTGCLQLDIDVQIGAYTDRQVEQMYEHIILLLHQVLAMPNAALSEISLVTSKEKEWQLHGFNRFTAEYPKQKTISRLFEEQVRKTPERIAVSCGGASLTYRELDERANRLAARLSHSGICNQSVVGIHMIHSLETVIGILGVFKAGGAYLPLDPSLPQERLAFMAEDAAVKLVLTNVSDSFSFAGDILRLDELDMKQGPAEPAPVSLNPSDLAYVIYTSGSTGKPKGTLIRQQALVNYICWACKMYVRGEVEVFPLYSSLAFDLTVTSLFTPLLSGGQIAVYPDDGDDYVLYRIMEENKATVLKLTPSHLSLLKGGDYRQSSVRRLIVGGEDFKSSLAAEIDAAWGGNVEIWNEYGPTEATVGCMIYKYDPEKDTEGSLPIGHPADNVQIYVLDSQLRLLPTGCVGEIHISGDGLAEGYLNRPDATEASFVRHPYLPNQKLYRTGDLGRFRPDGILEYKDRADAQLSIRGYRIEPGEIENALLAHPAIREAAVVSRSTDGSSPQLCAYIVAKQSVPIKELKAFLASRLPYYMIPLHMVTLESMPITRNGKLNRSALPEPSAIHEGSGWEESGFLPESKDAAILREAIGEVLGLERVGRGDNFYQLGGDSIKAIQVMSLLRTRGLRITANDILTHPIIGEMEARVQAAGPAETHDRICEGNIPHTPIISWFFGQEMEQPQHYHQRVLLTMKRPIPKDTLESMMAHLLRHHDTLRMNLEPGGTRLKYNNRHLSAPFRIQEHDLSGLSSRERHEEMLRIADAMESAQNLYTEKLIQAAVFVHGDQEAYLLLTAHHLVVDGVSWRILLEDLNQAVRQWQAGEEIAFSAKTLSYQQWAEKLERYGQRVKEEEGSYWEHVLSSRFLFPCQSPMGSTPCMDARDSLSFQLSEEETQQLVTAANAASRTRPLELIMTSLLLAIRTYTGRHEIILDLESHGRDELEEGLDVSRTVGWFTNIFPFSIVLEGTDLASAIKQVKERLRNIPANGAGYGILKYLNGEWKDSGERELLFNYLGEFTGARRDDMFELACHPEAIASSRSGSSYGIEINGAILHRRLSLQLSYRSARFARAEMELFMHEFHSRLRQVVQFCSQQTESVFTPSDFDGADLTQSELDSIFSS